MNESLIPKKIKILGSEKYFVFILLSVTSSINFGLWCEKYVIKSCKIIILNQDKLCIKIF